MPTKDRIQSIEETTGFVVKAAVSVDDFKYSSSGSLEQNIQIELDEGRADIVKPFVVTNNINPYTTSTSLYVTGSSGNSYVTVAAGRAYLSGKRFLQTSSSNVNITSQGDYSDYDCYLEVSGDTFTLKCDRTGYTGASNQLLLATGIDVSAGGTLDADVGASHDVRAQFSEYSLADVIDATETGSEDWGATSGRTTYTMRLENSGTGDALQLANTSTGLALQVTAGDTELLSVTATDIDIGGGYGSTGVTISAAGVIQANGALTADGLITGGAGLSITGNISVTGNVDGVDVSAIALDNMPTAATGDISCNSQNITSVGNVDGVDVGSHTHGGGTGGPNIPEANVTFSATGHSHDGTGSENVSYDDLDDVPATFAPSAHALNGADHTGDLAYTQIDSLVLITGSGTTTTISRSDHLHTGSDGSGQIDYGDLLNSAHALAGAEHTASGLTVGWVIAADGATTFSWQQLDHTLLASVGSNTHAAIDSHISDTSNPHGSTLTQTTIRCNEIDTSAGQTMIVLSSGYLLLQGTNSGASSWKVKWGGTDANQRLGIWEGPAANVNYLAMESGTYEWYIGQASLPFDGMYLKTFQKPTGQTNNFHLDGSDPSIGFHNPGNSDKGRIWYDDSNVSMIYQAWDGGTEWNHYFHDGLYYDVYLGIFDHVDDIGMVRALKAHPTKKYRTKHNGQLVTLPAFDKRGLPPECVHFRRAKTLDAEGNEIEVDKESVNIAGVQGFILSTLKKMIEREDDQETALSLIVDRLDAIEAQLNKP